MGCPESEVKLGDRIMKKNSELEVGDIIEVPVPHTAHVTKHVITRVTATQYITSTRKFNKQLKVLGTNGKYPVYGQQPKAIEPVAEPVKAEPVGAVVTVDVTAEIETAAPAAPKLTAADHVVVFKSPEQANKVAYAAANYNRAAILVRNFNGETHIIKAFETKKAAIEAKKDGSVSSQLSVVTRNDSTHNVNFYNIIGAANAISGSGNDVLVETDHPTKQHLKGVYGKIYAKIATPESQPVIQEIPESQEVVELPTTTIKISFGEARKIVRMTKNHPNDPIYTIVVNAKGVASSGINLQSLHKNFSVGSAYGGVRTILDDCRLLGFDDNDERFRFQHVGFPSATYEAAIDACRVKHPSGKGWIYFDLPKGFDPLKPCDFIAISDAYDLYGDEYALEFGTGEYEILDLTRPIRVYGIDMVWGGVRREKVCICRHPDLDECDDDDDGFKPPRICQPIEPWLQIDNDGCEDMYKYQYLDKEMLS